MAQTQILMLQPHELLRAYNAAKYDCGRGFVPDPVGDLTVLPQLAPNLRCGRVEGEREKGKVGTGPPIG